jgi:hypothetical protein
MPKKRKGKAAQAENASRARNARLLAMELASHPNPTCPNTPSESCLNVTIQQSLGLKTTLQCLACTVGHLRALRTALGTQTGH